ncbi:hypothetical protein JD844_012572 [Phrynosoma platyrhinos]|uniref:Uncharacterized protein n=1 Tax=Phrynosoma platyrhinos TaxID=52577 RepID=A0ABQ7TKG2_PHRPL|nr:hypothetical protein JD844_012572 [Phrynosoma platyrhinos]
MCTFRKLLREDQLEAVTKAAQQEELERRKRLEQQRKDYQASIPTVPLEFLPALTHVYCVGLEEIALRTAEVAQLPPQVLAEDVICLDSTSSGSEDDSKGRLHSIKDGKNGWKLLTIQHCGLQHLWISKFSQ